MTILPRFSDPWLLMLLAVVPALVWWWRRRGQGSMGYSSIDLLVGLPAGRSGWARNGGSLLRLLGLTCVVIALAGPRWPDRGSRLTTEGIALAMVVDVSGSMKTEDFLWDDQKVPRLEGVKKIFRLFIEGGQAPDGSILSGRPQDLVTFVKYARFPTTVCPLTLDHAVLFKNLKDLSIAGANEGADSNPGDAIGWAVNSLRKAAVKRKVIILLTDGESNVKGEAWRPFPAANVARNSDIPIYVIDALPDNSADPEAEKATRQSLQEVANISNGRYFKASDARALAEVYAQIDQLERSRIDSPEYSKYYDGFMWFALVGLASWLNLVFLESTLWRKVP
jgi:Ca-activated chloride channel family protein